VPVRKAATILVCAGCGAALLLAAWGMDAGWFERHVLLPCYYHPPSPGALRGVRAVFAAGGLLLIAVAWPLGRAAAHGTAAGAARIALAVVLALAASEWILRLGGRGQPFWRRDKVEFNIGRVDPRYGWVLLPSRTTAFGAPPVRYAVDAWGDRARSDRGSPDPARPTIVVSGESDAAGHAIEYEQTFPALLEGDLGLQVVNVAAGGYGTDQAFLRLDDALARLRRPVAAVTTFLPVMLQRNLQDYRPLLVLRGGALELVPPADGFFARLRLRDLLVNELPWLSESRLRESLQLTSAILRETARRSRQHGAAPLFVVPSVGPPRPFEAHREAWILRELFVEPRLHFVLVDLPPDELVAGDGHPGPGGHRRLADAIEAALPRPLVRAQ